MKIVVFLILSFFSLNGSTSFAQSEPDKITTNENKTLRGRIIEYSPEKEVIRLEEKSGIVRLVSLKLTKRIHVADTVIQNINGELLNPESVESKKLQMFVSRNLEAIKQTQWWSEKSFALSEKTDSVIALESSKNPVAWQQVQLLKIMYYEMAKKEPSTAVGIGFFIPGGAQFYAGNTLGGFNYGLLRTAMGILAINTFNKNKRDSGWLWTGLYVGTTFLECFHAGSIISDHNNRIQEDINNSLLLPEVFGMSIHPDVKVGFSVSF